MLSRPTRNEWKDLERAIIGKDEETVGPSLPSAIKKKTRLVPTPRRDIIRPRELRLETPSLNVLNSDFWICSLLVVTIEVIDN